MGVLGTTMTQQKVFLLGCGAQHALVERKRNPRKKERKGLDLRTNR